MGTIHLGHEATRGFDPVATAVEECYGTTRSLTQHAPLLEILEHIASNVLENSMLCYISPLSG